MRLIDADALKEKAFFHEIDNVSYVEEEDIDEAPTVDSVERKRGEWVDEKYREPLFDIAGVKTWGVEFRCSECGFVHTVIEANGRYKFCPNCGAEMRGEKE